MDCISGALIMYKKEPDIGGKVVNGIRRLSDNAFIPFDPQNRDYAEYLEWVAAGNVPTPADEPTQE
jgi:hypothetical protein